MSGSDAVADRMAWEGRREWKASLFSYSRSSCVAISLFLSSSFILFVVYSVIVLEEQSTAIHHLSLSALTDFDSFGCNGISLATRVFELKRTLSSVRKELLEASASLESVNLQHEHLSSELAAKIAELKRLESEIENGHRLLKDLHDRRNVRVSLPKLPLIPPNPFPISSQLSAQRLHAFDDIIDYSRCSLSSQLRVFIYPSTTRSQHPLYSALLSSRYAVKEASKACLFITLHSPSSRALSLLSHWVADGTNHVVVNVGTAPIPVDGHAIFVQSHFPSLSFRPNIDYALPLSSLEKADSSFWQSLPSLLPYSRRDLLLVFARENWNDFSADSERLLLSAARSQDSIRIISCRNSTVCSPSSRDEEMRHSLFTAISPSPFFLEDLMAALKTGTVPVVLSLSQPLPFQDTIAWSEVLLRIPLSRFPELHFILRSFSMADTLELRRRGRRVLQSYLLDSEVVAETLLRSLSERLGLPSAARPASPALPLFGSSFTPPILTPVNLQPFDDEFLGPMEAPFSSPSFLHNFSEIQLYSYSLWNELAELGGRSEFLATAAEPPAESEFFQDSASGFRPIEPGSGHEFSLALGGNRQREQFTVVILTFNRDAILSASLERLHRCPYLHKVVVIWNGVGREPQGAWPRLHVPVEFIRVASNSLNNRFIPWDRIETEAVLSLDDDIDLKQHEIVFAFRVWREERTRIVGFPARFHARVGEEVFYNSNHTCQISMVLTGAAFIHKAYFYAYTYGMPAAVREHVNKVTNCEDIAMNFLVSHITRKPPIKTTSKWTLRCPTCTESLWSAVDHFKERHECIRLFSRIFGYNPLRFSQFRADSVLFKTRLPADKQKCFRYV